MPMGSILPSSISISSISMAGSVMRPTSMAGECYATLSSYECLTFLGLQLDTPRPRGRSTRDLISPGGPTADRFLSLRLPESPAILHPSFSIPTRTPLPLLAIPKRTVLPSIPIPERPIPRLPKRRQRVQSELGRTRSPYQSFELSSASAETASSGSTALERLGV